MASSFGNFLRNSYQSDKTHQDLWHLLITKSVGRFLKNIVPPSAEVCSILLAPAETWIMLVILPLYFILFLSASLNPCHIKQYIFERLDSQHSKDQWVAKPAQGKGQESVKLGHPLPFSAVVRWQCLLTLYNVTVGENTNTLLLHVGCKGKGNSYLAAAQAVPMVERRACFGFVATSVLPEVNTNELRRSSHTSLWKAGQLIHNRQKHTQGCTRSAGKVLCCQCLCSSEGRSGAALRIHFFWHWILFARSLSSRFLLCEHRHYLRRQPGPVCIVQATKCSTIFFSSGRMWLLYVYTSANPIFLDAIKHYFKWSDKSCSALSHWNNFIQTIM